MPDALPPDDDLVAWLRDHADPAALTLRQIAEGLGLPREARSHLGRRLRALVRESRVMSVRGKRFGAPERLGDAVGRYVRHPVGYGFVIVEEPGEADVFIPPGEQRDALHNDLVAARVVDVKEDGRREGRIVGVVEHRGGRLLGIFHPIHRGGGVVEPLDEAHGFEVRIEEPQAMGASSGEVVSVELSARPGPAAGARGRVVERLGMPDAPETIDAIVVRRYAISEEFPKDALADAAALPGQPEAWPLGEREDFRQQAVVTIDGADARDFDDAVHVERLPGGGHRLSVHIADVGFFVREGSPLDREALRRGTSVYLPRRVVPMLPERLSNDLCSLVPNQVRLVQSAIMDFDGEGRLVAARSSDGVIRSHARMTYDEVNLILEASQTPEGRAARARREALVAMLEEAQKLAGRLAAKRAERGALDLEAPEPVVAFDKEGRIASIEARARGVAERMIEEFMIAANRAVAAELIEAEEPALHRVHEAPEPKKVTRLDQMLEAIGYGPPGGRRATPRPRDLAEVLMLARGKPEEPLVRRLVLRSMALARYDPHPLGHFGLAIRRYAHFTSPIRRYPDLVVHRALRALRKRGRIKAGAAQARHDELAEVGVETSRLERDAEAAEREAVARHTAAFMETRVGERFAGRVVEVDPRGLVVQLQSPFVEARLSIARLGREYIRYDPRKVVLIGTQSGRVYRIGTELEVVVDRVDPLRFAVELALPDEELGEASAARPRSRRRKDKSGKPVRRGPRATRRRR